MSSPAIVKERNRQRSTERADQTARIEQEKPPTPRQKSQSKAADFEFKSNTMIQEEKWLRIRTNKVSEGGKCDDDYGETDESIDSTMTTFHEMRKNEEKINAGELLKPDMVWSEDEELLEAVKAVKVQLKVPNIDVSLRTHPTPEASELSEEEERERQLEFDERYERALLAAKPVELRIRSLMREADPSPNEIDMLLMFVDKPTLLEAVWTMSRKWRTERAQERKRCHTCEEFIGGVRILPHIDTACRIPIEMRTIFMARMFKGEKCFNCGILSKYPHSCYPETRCVRCEDFGNEYAIPHRRWSGLCYWIRKARNSGVEPTEENLWRMTEMEASDERAGRRWMNRLLEDERAKKRNRGGNGGGDHEKSRDSSSNEQ